MAFDSSPDPAASVTASATPSADDTDAALAVAEAKAKAAQARLDADQAGIVGTEPHPFVAPAALAVGGVVVVNPVANTFLQRNQNADLRAARAARDIAKKARQQIKKVSGKKSPAFTDATQSVRDARQAVQAAKRAKKEAGIFSRTIRPVMNLWNKVDNWVRGKLNLPAAEHLPTDAGRLAKVGHFALDLLKTAPADFAGGTIGSDFFGWAGANIWKACGGNPATGRFIGETFGTIAGGAAAAYAATLGGAALVAGGMTVGTAALVVTAVCVGVYELYAVGRAGWEAGINHKDFKKEWGDRSGWNLVGNTLSWVNDHTLKIGKDQRNTAVAATAVSAANAAIVGGPLGIVGWLQNQFFKSNQPAPSLAPATAGTRVAPQGPPAAALPPAQPRTQQTAPPAPPQAPPKPAPARSAAPAAPAVRPPAASTAKAPVAPRPSNAKPSHPASHGSGAPQNNGVHPGQHDPQDPRHHQQHRHGRRPDAAQAKAAHRGNYKAIPQPTMPLAPIAYVDLAGSANGNTLAGVDYPDLPKGHKAPAASAKLSQ